MSGATRPRRGAIMASAHVSRESLRSLLSATVLCLALLFAGCASSETLQQTRVWGAYASCKAAGRVESNVQIERVEPNGRWWWRTGDGSLGKAKLEACMREELAKWTPAAGARGAAASAPLQGGDLARPVWNVGDEWAYRYEGPSGSGGADGAAQHAIGVAHRGVSARRG